MGFALLKKDTGEEADGGVTVTDRLIAWWNGDEPDGAPVPARRKSRSSGNGPDDGTETGDAGDPGSGGAGSWSEVRRQVAQEIWSPGFVVPGGAEYIEKLVSGLSLASAETLLEIGIGMGGGTRTIIGKFGNQVIGYDRDPDLAAAAMRHAVTYEIDDRLEVKAEPLEELELPPNFFRAALMRDVLYTIDGKADLVSRIGESLKSGESVFVLTDFLFDDGDQSDELAAWKAVEECPVYPWSKDALVGALGGAGMTVRVLDDESEEYCAMVVDAWSDYMKTINGSEVTPELGRMLEKEGEFWARRVAAIKAGVLRYYRVEAVKIS